MFFAYCASISLECTKVNLLIYDDNCIATNWLGDIPSVPRQQPLQRRPALTFEAEPAIPLPPMPTEQPRAQLSPRYLIRLVDRYIDSW